ncbi:MAG: hypothetical protein GF368_01915 [Candidatus Aenigmarchaeota archaeon]|nr:hypothetical protein [Candidatus Aenigmarchaeota archaeon]
MANDRKINYDLLVAMPTEETKIFCIERVLRSVMSMRLPDSSHMLIATGRSDPIGGEIEKILDEYGPGNFQRITMRRLGIIRDQTIWDSEGFRPITLHRNFALRVARRFGYEELMFIDSDIETPENTYEELSRLGVDIAGGYYESRYFEERPFFGNRGADSITIPREGIDYEPGDVLEVDYTGLGCSLLSGRVITELMFPPTVYEAEDIAFLNQALEKGMTVKVHTGIRCDHHSLFDQRIPSLKGTYSVL